MGFPPETVSFPPACTGAFSHPEQLAMAVSVCRASRQLNAAVKQTPVSPQFILREAGGCSGASGAPPRRGSRSRRLPATCV